MFKPKSALCLANDILELSIEKYTTEYSIKINSVLKMLFIPRTLLSLCTNYKKILAGKKRNVKWMSNWLLAFSAAWLGPTEKTRQE